MVAQETFTAKDFRAELDRLGEDAVRLRFIAKQYGDSGDKHALVQEWLRQKDLSRQNRPAWVAAWAAVATAVIAIIAIAASFYQHCGMVTPAPGP